MCVECTSFALHWAEKRKKPQEAIFEVACPHIASSGSDRIGM